MWRRLPSGPVTGHESTGTGHGGTKAKGLPRGGDDPGPGAFARGAERPDLAQVSLTHSFGGLLTDPGRKTGRFP